MYWHLFVGAKDERTVEELAKQEPTIRKAMTVLEFLNQNDEARKLYDMRVKALRDEASMLEGARAEGRAEGKEVGKEVGKAVGMTEAKLEVARNMLRAGMSLEQTALLTGLSQKELEQLTSR